MSPTLAQLGENAILRQLLANLPSNPELLVAAGDDCAVVRGDDQWDILLKTDVVVEGMHFLRDTDPALVGRKALARAISDIAAMGGLPCHALVTLLVHPSRSMSYVAKLYELGICPLAERYGISIAGGETSSLPHDGLIINIALTGRVERERAILRSTAQVGDVICVSGKLGGSFESGRHLSFEPRLKLARQLIECGLVPSAMMDLSDGLSTDLERLAEASGCSYTIHEAALPLHAGCSSSEGMSDGEDYELLLCFSAKTWVQLQQTQAQLDICAIGEITAANAENKQEKREGGWQHFNNSTNNLPTTT